MAVVVQPALSRSFVFTVSSTPGMLICLVGPPQAGKDSLARFLTTHHGFTRVHLSPSSSSSAESLSFSSSSDFLDHATRTWRIDYVTTDLASKQKLQEFAKRPFVAIVAVDAPLGVRFNRAVRRRVTGSRSLVCVVCPLISR